MKRTRWTEKVKAAFIESLSKTGNVTLAAEAVGKSRRRAYELREEDPGFAADWEEAEAEAADRLEAEAWRRAHDGVLRLKFTSKGQPIMNPATGLQYFELEYSDTLLLALLKAHRPERFKERIENQHTGKNGDPLTLLLQDIGATPAASTQGRIHERESAGGSK